ncbi:related to DUF985 domain protein [Ramularia collo-cygni]|uniref:Related to DUF985 domain protein n=1 Tax=Ramularia collo-cygni TaxID=112498 RepID=A0A2D3UWE7_9PEZI|nr:related to DUF985 domain protein [Ramularia collo-cygni]CZT16537.1 related to DUF985 domain protein [Ramularia collo-cygni]
MTSQSTIDPDSPYLVPFFKTDGSQTESANLQAIMKKLNMQNHPEGGYFVETDRNTTRVPNPFGDKKGTRSSSTSIHYLLTPKSNYGGFHRNEARTVHTLHKGRGRYVIIHADEVASKDFPGGYGKESASESERWVSKARVETFIVGQNVLAGERLQWIVEGGKYKSSFLLPDEDGGSTSEGLLISETVVPGFEFEDHDFMKVDRMEALVTAEQAKEMNWMLNKDAQ